MKNPILKRVVLTSTVGLGLFWAGFSLSDTVEYRIDGWCLSHQKDAVEWPTTNSAFLQGIPMFFVRAQIPYKGSSDAPSKFGISVSYIKSALSTRQNRIDADGPGRRDCERVPVGNGLVQLEGWDPQWCRVYSDYQYFEAQEDSGPDAAITIRCSTNESVQNCRITDVMPNGWRASIGLPKTHLSEWRVATEAARNFFNETLEDCGVYE